MAIAGNKRREEVEKVIRSCLVSRQGNVTIEMLDNDYYEFEGEHIPFREFNFSSLSVFLRHLTDTLRLENRFSQTFVIPLDSEKSRHVRALVEGQKPKKTNHRRTQRPYLGFAGGRSQCQLKEVPHEIRISGNRLYSANKIPSQHNSFHNPSRQHNSFPNQSFSTGINKRPINRPQAMPDTSNARSPLNSNDQKELPVRFTGEDDEMGDINQGSSFIPAGYNPSSCSQKNGFKDMRNSYKEESYNRCQDSYRSQESYPETQNNLRKSPGKEESPIHDTPSPRNMQGSPGDHQNPFGEQYDVKNTNEFESHKNSYGDGEDYHDYDYMDDDALNENLNEDRGRLVSPRTKFRLTKLIQKYPEGIWCADLPNKYLEEYNFTLNYSELGFDSVREFASQLPSIFHCVRPSDAGDFKLYNAEKPPPDLRKKDRIPTQTLAAQYYLEEPDQPEPLPDRLDPSTCKRLIPDGVMESNETIGQISVTELGRDNDFEEVIVSEVFTPSFFWIQLRKKLPKFKRFMDDLHTFYEANSSNYKIPLIVLEKGLNVACVYGGKWHRGIIKTVPPEGNPIVHFYDYGTVKSYDPNDLFFLHRQFSFLAAQAIPCSLFNVKPYQSLKWSRSVTWEFVRKTSCPLVATIGERDEEENSMRITLTDTRGDDDFHINDWMYHEKFAERGCMDMDLKNICDYEESLLPRWDQLSDDELGNNIPLKSPLISSNFTRKQGPPPGFPALHPIEEEPIKQATNPNMSTLINNSPQNMFTNMGGNIPNIFNQNGFLANFQNSTNALSTLHLENLRLRLQLMLLSNPGLSIEEQTIALAQQIQEIQLLNDPNVLLNPFLNSPLHLNSNSNSIPSPQPVNVPVGNNESANPIASTIKKTDEHQKIKSKTEAEEKPQSNFWEQEKNLPENSILSPPKAEDPTDVSSNIEEFFKGIPTLEEAETFKDTNPFKTCLPNKKQERTTLKRFYNGFHSRNPNPIDNIKTNYTKPSDINDKANSDVFVLSKEEAGLKSTTFTSDKKTPLGTPHNPPGHNFAPVTSSNSAKVNSQGTKVIYEAGPVIYNKNNIQIEMAVEDKDNHNKSCWKPIPPAEPIKAEASSPAHKTVISFNIPKPNSSSKSPKEMQIKKEYSDSKDVSGAAAKDSILNTTPVNLDNKIDFGTPTDFSFATNWMNSKILSPVNLINFDSESDAKSSCKLEDDYLDRQKTFSERSPPATIYTSVTENIRIPHMFDSQSEGKSEKSHRKSIDINKTNGKVEFNPVNLTNGYLPNTNPFKEDITLANSRMAHGSNDASTNSEPSKTIQRVSESSSTETTIEHPPCQDDYSICYTYQLSSKNKNLLVINLADEGWLSTDEFVDAFTDLYGTSVLLSVLNLINQVVPFKMIDRTSHPALMAELDLTTLNVPRDSKNKILRPVHLTPLKSTLRILVKLKVITVEEFNAVLRNKSQSSENSLIRDVVRMLSNYATFMKTKCKK